MMTVRNAIYRIAMPAIHVEAFLAQCEAAKWFAFDTGERITTDAGWDAEAVLLVEPAASSQKQALRLGVTV